MLLKYTHKRQFSNLINKLLDGKRSIPRVEEGMKLDFKDVLIRPQITDLYSRSQVDLTRNFKFRHHDTEWEGVPIMAANMDTTGTFEIAEELAKEKLITCLHRHYSMETMLEWGKKVDKSVLNHTAITAGMNQDSMNYVRDALAELPDIKIICLDVANGYQKAFVQCVSKYREQFPDKIILAGNVVTPEITQILLQAGADIVKLGIGPGSVCTTRKQTGVGYPQLSVVLENAEIAHSMGGYIISDGGCTVPGDFAKAFCAGADFVMAGGTFAGHDESGGENVQNEETGKWYKKFYGMSSEAAMDKYAGGVAKYRSSEGKVVYLPHKGPVMGTTLDLLGGIRSTCTYVGAPKIESLPEKTTFIRVTQQLNNVYGVEMGSAPQE